MDGQVGFQARLYESSWLKETVVFQHRFESELHEPSAANQEVPSPEVLLLVAPRC